MSELDVPLPTLLCRLVTVLSYQEIFLLTLHQSDQTRTCVRSVVSERLESRLCVRKATVFFQQRGARADCEGWLGGIAILFEERVGSVCRSALAKSLQKWLI